MSKQLDVTPATIGPIASQVKSQVTPKRWARLVKQAHARGFAINSYLDPNTPDPLKQRTQASIAKQAERTVATAYAPAAAELNARETQLNSLAAKRKSDNEYYANWLSQKNADLMTAQNAATQQLSAGIDQIHKQTADALGAQPAQAQAEAAQTHGAISDFGTSKALTVDLDANKLHELSNLAASGQAYKEGAALGTAGLASTQANSFAFLAGQAAKQNADQFSELSKVADARQKLVLDKAAAANTEVSRLLDNETSKASQNRNYQAAAEKLGLEGDKLTEKTHVDAAKIANDARRAAETKRHNQQQEDAANVRNGISQQNADTSYYKSRHPKKPAGKHGSKVDPQERFDMVYSTLLGGKNQADGGAPFSTKYVEQHRDVIVARLVTATKVSEEMARRAVNAFIQSNRGDAGSYKDYTSATPKSTATPAQKTLGKIVQALQGG